MEKLAFFENFPLGVARRRSEKFQTYVYPPGYPRLKEVKSEC